MTSQEKKAYLERYKEADREIDRLCEELSRWRALATKITPVLSQEPAGSCEGGNQIELAVEKIIALEGQINAKIDEALIIRQRVEDAIQTVQDVHMNYTYQWTCSLHGKALKELIVIDT